MAQRGVEHPARLPGEPLGSPGVAVVEVGDHGVEQIWGDGADHAELGDRGQRDDALPDEPLGALGQLENLHARGHAVLRPAQRLRGAVLGQATVKHRTDCLGLLVRAQRLPSDVLHGAVGILSDRVADHDGNLGEPERARRGDAVKAGDELESVSVGTDHDRDEHALQLD
jgi:hypothetical protein